MSYKYTTDGRKVAIIGKLNAQETIVQEVYERDGCEFPAGENFVVKSLLDQPAETWKTKEALRVSVQLESAKAELLSVTKELNSFKHLCKAAMDHKINWTKGITQPEVDEAVERIRAFISGEYTHIVIPNWRIEILEFNPEQFTYCNVHRGEISLDGVKLVSLWAKHDHQRNRRGLSWRVNRWNDGSGCDTEFIPCRSLEEAKSEVFKLIDARDLLSDEDYETCEKLGIEPNREKNAARIARKIEALRKVASDSYAIAAKAMADISALGGAAPTSSPSIKKEDE